MRHNQSILPLVALSLVTTYLEGASVVRISGELKQWHKVTLTVDGPFANESDTDPNPFTDYCFVVQCVHESGVPTYTIPGYFAADGNAANSSAEQGNKWRAHLSPDKPGKWHYKVSFTRGKQVAVSNTEGMRIDGIDGLTGSFSIAGTDKTGRDLRAKGRLQYVGKHYLQFAGTKEYFLKAGPDAPENLLGYADFDGTRSNKSRQAREGEATPGGKLNQRIFIWKYAAFINTINSPFFITSYPRITSHSFFN